MFSARFLKSITIIIWAKRKTPWKKSVFGKRGTSWRSIFLTAKENCWKSPALFLRRRKYIFWTSLLPEIIKTVSGIIKNLKQEGKTVILIEHNMEIIRELCDYAIVMDSGKLLAQGKPEEVLRKKEVVEAYLGE